MSLWNKKLKRAACVQRAGEEQEGNERVTRCTEVKTDVRRRFNRFNLLYSWQE